MVNLDRLILVNVIGGDIDEWWLTWLKSMIVSDDDWHFCTTLSTLAHRTTWCSTLGNWYGELGHPKKKQLQHTSNITLGVDSTLRVVHQTWGYCLNWILIIHFLIQPRICSGISKHVQINIAISPDDQALFPYRTKHIVNTLQVFCLHQNWQVLNWTCSSGASWLKSASMKG